MWRQKKKIQNSSCLPRHMAKPACEDGMYQGGARDCGCDGRWSNSGPALVLVRSPLLTSHKWRELAPLGVWFADAMTSFSGLTFVLFCFALLRFRIYAFVEAAALRSTVLRYAGAPIATRVFVFVLFCFSFCLFGDVAFSEYFFAISAFSLYGL